ncbi:MAG: cbb3-type cytochrome c oxidase subunit I [Roseiarcus sp.]
MSGAATALTSTERTLAVAGRAAQRRELTGWGWIAVGALAVAGVFAILLALSRVPGVETALPWMGGFFYKGLVIHVVFSLVIWLLGVIAFVVSHATYEMASGAPRAGPLGRIGQGFALVAFPCLFAPAFSSSTEPALTNYIPLIIHPAYDVGLVLLGLGILAPIVRLFVNLPGRRAPLSPLAAAATSMAVIYVVALINFAVAAVALSRVSELQYAREQLNWGGGHVLQFGYAVLMLANWAMLARLSLGAKAFDPYLFKLAVGLIAAFTFLTLPFYFAFDPFGDKLHEAYRLLQFAIGVPALLVAVPIFASALKLGGWRHWPWRDPTFVALAVSVALFAVGGVMGLAITGSDTRTPAHYHAVITAVSVSSMGLLLTFGVETLGKPPVSPRAVRALVWLYGGGQMVASLGMFVAGGYGAPRKTPDGGAHLVDAAMAGMAVHGIGALVAVLGGAAFVVVAIRALARPSVASGA